MIKVMKDELIANILLLAKKSDLSANEIHTLKADALLAACLIEELEKERFNLLKSCNNLAKQRWKLMENIRQSDEAKKAGV